MGKYWNKVLLVGIVLAAALIPAMAGCGSEDNIMVRVHVLADQPQISNYVLRDGDPENVGIYEFYLERPDLPGTGAFRQLDSISLDGVNETEFYGEKRVPRIDGILCIGYPSTNFIDGKACIKIDQDQNEINITIHYWKTDVAIIGQ